MKNYGVCGHAQFLIEVCVDDINSYKEGFVFCCGGQGADVCRFLGFNGR